MDPPLGFFFSVIVIPLFLHALFLERVHVHRVIVVLLNILAAVKHKVFCAVSGFRTGRKLSPRNKDGAASVLACAVFHTFTDQGWVFFLFFENFENDLFGGQWRSELAVGLKKC